MPRTHELIVRVHLKEFLFLELQGIWIKGIKISEYKRSTDRRDYTLNFAFNSEVISTRNERVILTIF